MLSQALVAFTVEFDNEGEHRMAHRTTRHGATEQGALWLTSQAMWANVMRYVPDGGITVGELRAQARTNGLKLRGLKGWRYITLDGEPDKDATVIRCTKKGALAQEQWRTLAAEIEARWGERFGRSEVSELRDSLDALLGQIRLDLPRYMPMVYPTQGGRAERARARDEGEPPAITDEDIDLSVLLSRLLLAFTLDFEEESRVSLTICANTLRVLTMSGVRVRDIPVLTGISREGNAMATGFLRRIGCVVEKPDPAASRGKVVCLTEKGARVQAKYRRVLAETEDSWVRRFGAEPVRALRGVLGPMVGDGTPSGSALFGGLEPYPDNWRTDVRPPATLPHHPMVLHRGGFPDGS